MNFLEAIKNKIASILNLNIAPGKSLVQPDNGNFLNDNSWFNYLNDIFRRCVEDKAKYADYDLMDAEIPEVSEALDVMSDFVIYPDNINKIKSFKIKSKKYQKQVDEITKTSNFVNEFYSIIRSTLKYGDDFEECLKTVDRQQIVKFRNIPIDTVGIKIENGILDVDKPYLQVGTDGNIKTSLSKEECIHFCLNSDRKRFIQTGKGVSKIEKARLIYRQLRLMEEGVIVSRLSRANQNYGILVDVGDLVGDEALDYLDKYRKKIQRRKYVDPTTGRLSYQFNPISVLEDMYIPTRQGSGANVIPLNNSANNRDISDVEYFQNKLIYAIGIPKFLVGKEEDINSKSTSDNQVMSFLRSIRRIQTTVEPSILYFYTLALLSRGINDPSDLSVDWPIMGTIDEERKWNIMQIKVNIAKSLSQDMTLIDDYYIYTNFLDMNDDEIDELVTRMAEEEEKYKDEIQAEIDTAIDQTDNPEADAEFDNELEKEPAPKSSNPKTKNSEEMFKALNRIDENGKLLQNLLVLSNAKQGK